MAKRGRARGAEEEAEVVAAQEVARRARALHREQEAHEAAGAEALEKLGQRPAIDTGAMIAAVLRQRPHREPEVALALLLTWLGPGEDVATTRAQLPRRLTRNKTLREIDTLALGQNVLLRPKYWTLDTAATLVGAQATAARHRDQPYSLAASTRMPDTRPWIYDFSVAASGDASLQTLGDGRATLALKVMPYPARPETLDQHARIMRDEARVAADMGLVPHYHTHLPALCFSIDAAHGLRFRQALAGSAVVASPHWAATLEVTLAAGATPEESDIDMVQTTTAPEGSLYDRVPDGKADATVGALLWMVWYTLEAENATTGFAHRNLWPGNVRRRTLPAASAYHGRDWLYVRPDMRAGAAHDAVRYHVVPAALHGNQWVEMANFGDAECLGRDAPVLVRERALRRDMVHVLNARLSHLGLDYDPLQLARGDLTGAFWAASPYADDNAEVSSDDYEELTEGPWNERLVPDIILPSLAWLTRGAEPLSSWAEALPLLHTLGTLELLPVYNSLRDALTEHSKLVLVGKWQRREEESAPEAMDLGAPAGAAQARPPLCRHCGDYRAAAGWDGCCSDVCEALAAKRLEHPRAVLADAAASHGATDAPPLIVVTVPHAYCTAADLARREQGRRSQDVPHACDYLAAEAATQLVATLKAQGAPGVWHHPAVEEHRSRVDLNRAASRDTAYRLALSRRLAAGHVRLLLDVHSYPNGAFQEGAQLVVLDDEPGTSYGHDLYQRLKHAGVAVAHVLGSSDNDLVEEARAHTVPALLLEYNEALERSELARVNAIVAEWAVDM